MGKYNAKCSWEDSCSLFELFKAGRKLWRDTNQGPSNTTQFERLDHPFFVRFSLADVSTIVLFIPLWILIRFKLTKLLSDTLCDYCHSKSAFRERVWEQVYQLVMHIVFWLITAHVVLFHHECPAFINLSSTWTDYSLSTTFSTLERLLHLSVISYYIFSIYATLYIDEKRKDTAVLIVHHVVTITLVVISYTLRANRGGMMVLFCHDICDIFLDFSKLCFYLKPKSGKMFDYLETATTICFCLLIVVWLAFRLYLFPFRAIYVALSYPRNSSYTSVFMLAVIFLFVLLIMNIYWFYMILKSAYRRLSGQMLEDSVSYQSTMNTKAQ
ncbi:Ceramide synthase 1 [Halotydeus destructor]|nr:Ceramide synthase 1 [Halotydeus destructor]